MGIYKTYRLCVFHRFLSVVPIQYFVLPATAIKRVFIVYLIYNDKCFGNDSDVLQSRTKNRASTEMVPVVVRLFSDCCFFAGESGFRKVTIGRYYNK